MGNTVGSQRICFANAKIKNKKSKSKNFDFCIFHFEFSERSERLTP